MTASEQLNVGMHLDIHKLICFTHGTMTDTTGLFILNLVTCLGDLDLGEWSLKC